MMLPYTLVPTWKSFLTLTFTFVLFFTPTDCQPNPFAAPKGGELIPQGSTFIIKWEPTTRGPISLQAIGIQQNQNHPVLAVGIENTGQWEWKVEKEMGFAVGSSWRIPLAATNSTTGKDIFTDSRLFTIASPLPETTSTTAAITTISSTPTANTSASTNTNEPLDTVDNAAKREKVNVIPIVGGISAAVAILLLIGGGICLFRRLRTNKNRPKPMVDSMEFNKPELDSAAVYAGYGNSINNGSVVELPGCGKGSMVYYEMPDHEGILGQELPGEMGGTLQKH